MTGRLSLSDEVAHTGSTAGSGLGKHLVDARIHRSCGTGSVVRMAGVVVGYPRICVRLGWLDCVRSWLVASSAESDEFRLVGAWLQAVGLLRSRPLVGSELRAILTQRPAGLRGIVGFLSGCLHCYRRRECSD